MNKKPEEELNMLVSRIKENTSHEICKEVMEEMGIIKRRLGDNEFMDLADRIKSGEGMERLFKYLYCEGGFEEIGAKGE